MYDRDQEQQQQLQQPAPASSDAVGTADSEAPTYLRNVAPSDVRAAERATQRAEDCIVAQAVEILERRLERGVALTDPSIAGQFCAAKIRHFEREVFGVLFLDNRHRLLAFEILFYGTIDGAEVYPREVARAALRHNAAAIIVTHNHPSGSTEPSAADRAVTLRLRDALAMLEIRLLDHFIVGDGPATSLAARGWV
jgi:DNA repair protein RadC